MGIKSVQAGSQIYVRRNNAEALYIQPGKEIIDDNLYVLYDVKVNGIIIIPRGTRIVGDWITTKNGIIFSAKKIFIEGIYQDLEAESYIYDNVVNFDSAEVRNAPYLELQKIYKSLANISRRFVVSRCKNKILFDNFAQTPYIEIPNKEISIIILEDFISFKSAKYTTCDW